MPPRAQAIIWDVGGTLVEFACTLTESIRQRLDACAIDHRPISDRHIEQTYLEFIARDPQWRTIADERAAERQWLGALLGAGTIPQSVVDRAAQQMPRYFDLYRVVPGILDLLADLRALEIPMAVVSNWAPSLPEFLRHHGLSPFFDPIVYSAEDGIAKPDERIFQRCLKALAMRANNVVFIGDNPLLDIAPARALGMRAIHFDPRKTSDSADARDVPELRKQLWTTVEL